MIRRRMERPGGRKLADGLAVDPDAAPHHRLDQELPPQDLHGVAAGVPADVEGGAEIALARDPFLPGVGQDLRANRIRHLGHQGRAFQS